MTSRRASSGFTLLELMVILLLVSILVSFVTPIVSGSSAQNVLLREAERIRFELQELSRNSWIEGRSFQVTVESSGKWRLYTLLEEKWQIEKVLFVMDDAISFSSYSKALEDYSDKLRNGRLVFFSSGEYTPVKITLTKDDSSLVIEGDGLNEFVIQ